MKKNHLPAICPACKSNYVVGTMDGWMCGDCGATDNSPVSREMAKRKTKQVVASRVRHIKNPKSETGGNPNGFAFCGQNIKNHTASYESLEIALKDSGGVIRPCKKCVMQAEKLIS